MPKTSEHLMFSPLAIELQGTQYSGLSDQEAADILNSKVIETQVPVTVHALKQYAIFGGFWTKLKAGRSSPVQDVADLCMSVIDWIDDPRVQAVDVSIHDVRSMISRLVEAGIMTQQQADEIIAMGTIQVSWAQSIGYQEIGIGLVRNARKELNGQ